MSWMFREVTGRRIGPSPRRDDQFVVGPHFHRRAPANVFSPVVRSDPGCGIAACPFAARVQILMARVSSTGPTGDLPGRDRRPTGGPGV